MMLANHTSVKDIFETLRKQFKKLKQRDAHVQHFRETRLFQDSLDEFDDAEETVRSLVEEYKAAGTESYIEWGQGQQADDGMDHF